MITQEKREEIKERNAVKRMAQEIAEQNEPKEELEQPKEMAVDLSAFTGTKSSNISKDSAEPGLISFINHKVSMKLGLSRVLMTELGNPAELQFATAGGKLAVGVNVPGSDISYNVKQKEADKPANIYGAKLVEELTEALELDFSNVSCITFRKVEYTTFEGSRIAIISK